MTPEIEKAIKKAKKLFRLTESTNPNESATATKQLNKLKDKYNLTDEMIEPIFVKTIVEYKYECTIYSYNELMYFKIGEIFGNKVFAENNKIYEIKYKGNKTTINKALKTMDFIDSYIDEFYPNIQTTDMNSTRTGIVSAIIDSLQELNITPELVEDEKAESTVQNLDDVVTPDIEEKEHPNRLELDLEEVQNIKKQVSKQFLIGIKQFIRFL